MEKFGKPRGVYLDTCERDDLYLKAFKHDDVPVEIKWTKSLSSNATHDCFSTKVNGFDRLLMAPKVEDKWVRVEMAS